MRILFLALDVDLAGLKGDAVHVRELARFLAERGNQVDVVAASPLAGETPPNVRVHVRPDAPDLTMVRFCVRIARDVRASAVYERRLSPKIAFGVSRLAGIPFVVEVNGSEEELAVQGRERPALYPARLWARRRMFRRAARVVAVTAPLGDEIRRRYGLPRERVVVIPNGVDGTLFAPRDRDRARTDLRFPPGHWILFVGNLAPWQGLDTLLAAIAILRKEDPAARAAIVGEGPSRADLGRRCRELGVEDVTTFRGAIAHREIPAYIAASDVCVLPSARRMNERVGRSPLKLFEYMACARPVVASDIPGVRDVVERSGGGVLVPPDDPGALSAALVRLLCQPKAAREMGEQGRRYVLTERTWARTAERVESVLRDSLGRPGNSPLA